MTWFSRTKSRGRVLPRGTVGAIREFVYLDEVAVTSMVSSLLGTVMESSTESVTREILAELATSHDAKVPFYSGSVSGKVGGNLGSGRSVHRKANIQAIFSELEGELQGRYCLRANKSQSEQATHTASLSLDEALRRGWAVAVDDLARGKPFEVDVELGLDESYSILALIETFNDFASEQELIGEEAAEAFRPAQSLGRVLRMMMGGLVPLDCTLPDLRVVSRSGSDFLVNTAMVPGLGVGSAARPVRLVAICEETLFWKDIRRVAFERGRYRITGRIARSGLQRTWSPIKMSEVIRRYAPEVARELDALPTTMAEAMHAGIATANSISPGLINALECFESSLAAKRGLHKGDSSMDELVRMINPGLSYDTPDEWRPLFDKASRYLADKWVTEFSPEELLEARAGLLPEGPRTAVPGVRNESGSADGLYLEADIIAIHW